MNILFTSAGRRTYMVEFALAMTNKGKPVNVFVGDYLRDVPAKHVSQLAESIYIPRVDGGDEAFVDSVFKNSIEKNIDLVIPLTDFELRPLARHKDRFLRAGIFLVVSDPDVIDNTMNKKNAYIHCRAHGIPTPESAFSADDYDGRFPAIVKPIEGSASQDLRYIQEPSDLAVFRDGVDMVQTLIEGDEYGIDILNDFDGNFVKATIKKKLLMRTGETDRAEIANFPMLENLAERIGEVFAHNGNLDVDVIVDKNDNPYFLDFNARFGGGYPATHVAGMKYLAALVDLAQGRKPKLPSRPDPITVVKGISIHVADFSK